jgi:hypothetical protein
MDHKAIEHLMELHDNVWEELMDAKHYLGKRAHADKAESKALYLSLASDELGHAKKLIHECDAMFGKDETSPLEQVWHHLRKRLYEEHAKLESELKS